MQSGKTVLMLGKRVRKIWFNNAVGGNVNGNILWNSTQEQGPKGQKQVSKDKGKKITGFLLAHFKLNAQRLPATLKRMSYNMYDAAHHSMIYSREKNPPGWYQWFILK